MASAPCCRSRFGRPWASLYAPPFVPIWGPSDICGADGLLLQVRVGCDSMGPVVCIWSRGTGVLGVGASASTIMESSSAPGAVMAAAAIREAAHASALETANASAACDARHEAATVAGGASGAAA